MPVFKVAPFPAHSTNIFLLLTLCNKALVCVNCRHLACGRWVGDTPRNRCEDGGGGFDEDLSLLAVMSAAFVERPHDGCGSLVAYQELQDHKIACPHGPCTCLDPGCDFAGPPAAFVVYLAVAHSLTLSRGLQYGKIRVSQVAVPLPGSPDWHRVGQGEDVAVFVVTIGTLGPATVVSLVCVRSAACFVPAVPSEDVG